GMAWPGRWWLPGLSGGAGRRYNQRSRRARLTRLTGRANSRGIACATGLRLIRTDGPPPENRHHYQPAISELIITHDGVAIVRCLTCPAEAFEDIVSRDGAVENFARRVVLPAFLREDGYARIDRLHNVIRPDGETVVRRVAQCGRALRPFKPDAKPVEARDDRRAR